MKTSLLRNALVISHLHYEVFLLDGIFEKVLTALEKQLSWAIEVCSNRTKIKSSPDLKRIQTSIGSIFAQGKIYNLLLEV